MTTSKDEVLPIIKEFPKYKIIEELKKEALKEFKQEIEAEIRMLTMKC